MSLLKAYIKELDGIKTEIKRLNDHIKPLRSRQRQLEKEIKSHLEVKPGKGVKCGNDSFTVEETVKHLRRKKADKETETKRLLTSMGIYDVNKAYSDIIDVQKGEEVHTTKLRIKKNKDGK